MKLRYVIKTTIMLTFILAATQFALVSTSAAQEAGRYPRVIARGESAAVIRSTPIELRPNRPLHFYGNSVRRGSDRGNTLPTTRATYRTPVASLFRLRGF